VAHTENGAKKKEQKASRGRSGQSKFALAALFRREKTRRKTRKNQQGLPGIADFGLALVD
jgi:hypothetical protein